MEPRAAIEQPTLVLTGLGSGTATPQQAEVVKGLTFPILLSPGFCMNLQAGHLSRLKQRKGRSF